MNRLHAGAATLVGTGRVDLAEAAGKVGRTGGEFRIPGLLKRVDRLASGLP